MRSVPRESPAYESGLSVDDEIIAIDDFRLRPDQLAQRLENYQPGDKVSILVARRDQLTRIPLTLGEEPRKCSWKSGRMRRKARSGTSRSGWESRPIAVLTKSVSLPLADARGSVKASESAPVLEFDSEILLWMHAQVSQKRFHAPQRAVQRFIKLRIREQTPGGPFTGVERSYHCIGTGQQARDALPGSIVL